MSLTGDSGEFTLEGKGIKRVAIDPDYHVFRRLHQQEIEATITAARPSRTAGWRFVLDDGSTWLQTDAIGFRRDPKPGMKIRIRRAAMGSYLANVEGQLAVRVKRVVE